MYDLRYDNRSNIIYMIISCRNQRMLILLIGRGMMYIRRAFFNIWMS